MKIVCLKERVCVDKYVFAVMNMFRKLSTLIVTFSQFALGNLVWGSHLLTTHNDKCTISVIVLYKFRFVNV